MDVFSRVMESTFNWLGLGAVLVEEDETFEVEDDETRVLEDDSLDEEELAEVVFGDAGSAAIIPSATRTSTITPIIRTAFLTITKNFDARGIKSSRS
jgi:hypothetical protein